MNLLLAAAAFSNHYKDICLYLSSFYLRITTAYLGIDKINLQSEHKYGAERASFTIGFAQK